MDSEKEPVVGPMAGDVGVSRPDGSRALRATYGRIATGGVPTMPGCCGPSGAGDVVAATNTDSGIEEFPSSATELSLGCGNPVGLANLQAGQTVLDLGSGGGLDCFLAAEEVGESGHVIGVDMTPEMLDRARAAQRRRGASNVEFRLGEVEHLPVADGTIDVVISNCVLNLVEDRVRVFREAFRTLKAGGLLVVSDMMIGAPLPEAVRAALGPAAVRVCLERDYLAAIETAGFVEIEVVRRASPRLPPDGGNAAGPSPGAYRGARAIVRIGETGETRSFDIDPASLPDGTTVGTKVTLTRSVTVRARKPW